MVRPDKVAAVEEIQERLGSASAAVLTEYRGLSVPALAHLRSSLRDAGTTYKVYKNSLVRRAADAAGIDGEISDLLVGPTAFAFVTDGDVVTAAKALRDFSRGNEALVIKGGLLEGRFITAEQVAELADLPTRDELVAKVAGAFKAPMYKAAGLFSALQRKTAYAVKALIDKRVEAGEAPAPEAPSPEAAAEAAEAAEETGNVDVAEQAATEEPAAAQAEVTEPEAAEEPAAEAAEPGASVPEEAAAKESASPTASEAEDSSPTAQQTDEATEATETAKATEAAPAESAETTEEPEGDEPPEG